MNRGWVISPVHTAQDPCARQSMKFVDHSGVKFTARQVIGEISGESEKEKKKPLGNGIGIL